MGWVVNARSWPLYPGERDRVPTVQEAGWAHGRSGRVRKITPPEFDPRAVQPITSRYSDYAIPPHKEPIFHENMIVKFILGRRQTGRRTCGIVFTASRTLNVRRQKLHPSYLELFAHLLFEYAPTLESFIRRVFLLFFVEKDHFRCKQIH